MLGFERTEVEDAFHRLRLRGRVALTQASVIKMGEELDAEHVVFGSFQVLPPATATGGASLKISARVLDRRRMRLGNYFYETGALDDLATVEAHLAWRVC